ncbi:hypothetical protein [Caballeronia sp. S22]|uniref:hypothetical protein n=1 Tax=Caballeronia sp. S22 TaxID=3137182 RepID=UPI003530C355
MFTNSGADDRLREITELFDNHYQAAFRANFQGVNDIQEIEADAVTRLKNITKSYASVQFMEGIKAHEKKRAA